MYIFLVSDEILLLKHFLNAVGTGITNHSLSNSCAYLPGILESDAAVDFLPVFAVLADEDDGLGGVLLLRLLRERPGRRLLELLARLDDRLKSGRCLLVDSSRSRSASANACCIRVVRMPGLLTGATHFSIAAPTRIAMARSSDALLDGKYLIQAL